jgi:Domain of unknown function (DUF4386)
MVGDAAKPNPSRPNLDKEQHAEDLEPHGLHGEVRRWRGRTGPSADYVLARSSVLNAHGRVSDSLRDVAWLSTNVGSIFFAVRSTLFAYLLLKARSIPVLLARLGVVASLILVVGVPLETAAGRMTADGASIILWLPMLVFEIATGLWLLVKGAWVPITDAVP